MASEILLLLLSSEHGTEVFQARDRCCFFLFPVPYISVVVLLSSAEGRGTQVRRELGAHTSLARFFSLVFNINKVALKILHVILEDGV